MQYSDEVTQTEDRWHWYSKVETEHKICTYAQCLMTDNQFINSTVHYTWFGSTKLMKLWRRPISPSHSAVMQVGLHQVKNLSSKTDRHTHARAHTHTRRKRRRIKPTWAALQGWAAAGVNQTLTDLPVSSDRRTIAASTMRMTCTHTSSQQSSYAVVGSQSTQHYQVFPAVKQTTPSALISRSIVSLAAAAALAVRIDCRANACLLSMDCGTPISPTLFFLCVCACACVVLYTDQWTNCVRVPYVRHLLLTPSPWLSSVQTTRTSMDWYPCVSHRNSIGSEMCPQDTIVRYM